MRQGVMACAGVCAHWPRAGLGVWPRCRAHGGQPAGTAQLQQGLRQRQHGGWHSCRAPSLAAQVTSQQGRGGAYGYASLARVCAWNGVLLVGGAGVVQTYWVLLALAFLDPSMGVCNYRHGCGCWGFHSLTVQTCLPNAFARCGSCRLSWLSSPISRQRPSP